MLVKKIYSLPPETTQRSLDGAPDAGGSAVEAGDPAILKFIAELGGDPNLRAPISKRFRQKLLVYVGSVKFRRVKVTDAEIQGAMDHRDRVPSFDPPVNPGERH